MREHATAIVHRTAIAFAMAIAWGGAVLLVTLPFLNWLHRVP